MPANNSVRQAGSAEIGTSPDRIRATLPGRIVSTPMAKNPR